MKKIKTIRILIATVITMAFFWLGWREIPNFGMFRILPNMQPDLNIGTSVFVIADGKIVNSYAIEEFKRGWLIIWLGWPFVLFSKMLGFAEGYPLGEFSRRNFVVNELNPKKMREKIYQERDEMRIAFFKTQFVAECLRIKAYDLYADAHQKYEEISIEHHETNAMRLLLDGEFHNAEKLQHKLEVKERELAKAKAQVKRLKEKLRAKLGKWIDED